LDRQAVVDLCAAKLAEDTTNSARRLFHGRGHCYPGWEHVTISWYAPYLHLAFYKAVDASSIDPLVGGLLERCPQIQGVAVQFRDGRKTLTQDWYGVVPHELLVHENGLSYWIAPKRNQNVGLFLDMGHIRDALGESMAGAKVLNLFAFTCAFSVSAIAQGAELVVNNDMNTNMLKIGQRNHEVNSQDLRQVRMLPHNVFKAWKKLREYGPYDVIIVDPPTNQRGSFTAEKHYPQVMKQLASLAKPNARIVVSLNSPFLGHDFLRNHMARWAPRCRFQSNFGPHPDFPEADPERGLKVQDYRFS